MNPKLNSDFVIDKLLYGFNFSISSLYLLKSFSRVIDSSFSVILLILIFVRLQNPEFVKSISNISFDSYQKIFKFDERRDNIVIVDIDEPSLAKFGQFPWSRNVFSEILENINQDNPKSVGFDIFFSEKDKQSPEEIIKTYSIEDTYAKNILNSIEGHDKKFQKTLKRFMSSSMEEY